MEQVQLVAKDLAANPEIVRRHLGANAEWDAAHAVVLNALPFSLRRSPTLERHPTGTTCRVECQLSVPAHPLHFGPGTSITSPLRWEGSSLDLCRSLPVLLNI